MRLTGRVYRLERAHALGDCPECGDKGVFVISHVAEWEPEPIPQGCPACGEARHLIIRYRDEPLPNSPGRSGCTLSGAELARLYGCR